MSCWSRTSRSASRESTRGMKARPALMAMRWKRQVDNQAAAPAATRIVANSCGHFGGPTHRRVELTRWSYMFALRVGQIHEADGDFGGARRSRCHKTNGKCVNRRLSQPRGSPHITVSILCPTAFNAIEFPKLFQRSRKAIRAGVSVARLLSNLHFVPTCSRFGYRTLNQ